MSGGTGGGFGGKITRGTVVGGALFSAEFGAVVSNFSLEAILQAFQGITVNPSNDLTLTYYAPFVAVFGVIGLLEYFCLGVVNDTGFSWGFLVTYFVLVVTCAPFVSYLSPGAGVGMITSWLVVILGMIFKLFHNPPQYNPF